MTIVEAITKFIQGDAVKNKIVSVIDKEDSTRCTKDTIHSEEFPKGITKFQSLFHAIYLQRDKPIMITKSSKNEQENTKVFCCVANQE